MGVSNDPKKGQEKIKKQVDTPSITPPSRGEVHEDSSSKLNQLVTEIEREKRDELLKTFEQKNINYHSWLTMVGNPPGQKEEAIKQIGDYLPLSAGRGALIKGLSEKNNSDEYNKGYKCLDEIVRVLDKRFEYIEKSTEKAREIKEDTALGSVKDVLNKVVDNFKRGSGVEKAASLAALGIGVYFLHKLWGAKGADGKPSFTSTLMRIGLGGFAVNILTRLATGKSALEHLGVWQAKESLAPELRRLAEKVNIADNPQKLKAMIKLAGNPAGECFRLYDKYGKGASIDPANLGVFDGSLTGTEAYGLMQELMKKAGNGDEGKGKENFQNKYMAGTRWTLLGAAMDLYANEGATLILESDKKSLDKIRNEISSISNGEYVVGEKIPYVFILGYPATFERSANGQDYFFRIAPNKTVKLSVNQKPDERKEQMVSLKKYIKETIMQRLYKDPKLKNKDFKFINGAWVMKDVDFKGRKTDLTFEFDKTRPEAPSIKVLADGKEINEFAIAGTEYLDDLDLEKAQYAIKIENNFPLFRGLEVKILDFEDRGSGLTHVTGRVEGLNFTMAVKDNRCELDNPKDILNNEKFVEAKTKQAKDYLDPSIDKLQSIIHEIDEGHARVTVLWKGLSGSVKENFWKFTAEAKRNELIYLYKNKLAQAEDPRSAENAWHETVGVYKPELDDLYKKLFNAVKTDQGYSDEDFESALKSLDMVGYKSEEFKGIMFGIRNKLKDFDYEGWDKSDIWELASRIYGKAREAVNFFTAEFAGKDPLNDSEKAYLKEYLEPAIVDRMSEIKLKSKGLLKKSVNLENMPEGPTAWGIKRYNEWKG